MKWRIFETFQMLRLHPLIARSEFDIANKTVIQREHQNIPAVAEIEPGTQRLVLHQAAVGPYYETPLVPIRYLYYALRHSCFLGESSLIVGEYSSIVGESLFFETLAYLLHRRLFVFTTSFYFILWWVFVSVTSSFITFWGIFVISSLSYSLHGRIFVNEGSPTIPRRRIFVHKDSPTILLQRRHEGKVENAIILTRRTKGECWTRRFAHKDARLRRSSKHDY